MTSDAHSYLKYRPYLASLEAEGQGSISSGSTLLLWIYSPHPARALLHSDGCEIPALCLLFAPANGTREHA